MWTVNEQNLLVMKKSVFAMSASFAAIAGAAAAAAVTVHRLTRIYEERMMTELHVAKMYYSRVNKTGDFATPEGAYEALHGEPAPVTLVDQATPEMEAALEALTKYGAGEGSIADVLKHYTTLPDHEKAVISQGLLPAIQDGEVVDASAPEGMQEIGRNIFTDAQVDVTDFDPEAEDRSPDHPYIIKFEEFLEGKPGFVGEELTYYEDDDVLTKSDDELIDDVNGLVGDLNLQKFGLGSEDKDIVYIRNEKYSADFQVTRHKGSYAQVVGGYIQHEDRPRLRKFRGDDE